MSPIPLSTIPIQLKKDTPSKVTPEALQKELNAIGLTCQHTTVENLKKYIDETVSRFPSGNIQGYGVFQYDIKSMQQRAMSGKPVYDLSEIVKPLTNIHSNWQPSGTSDYSDLLSTVGYPDNFDLLLANYKGFAGQKSSNTYQANDSTVEAIKAQFVKIADNISSVLVSDIDHEDLQPMFVNIIRPESEQSTDYDNTVNRNIYLIKGVSPDHRSCEGIGVLNVLYRLRIKNYKEKKSRHQSYQLDVTVRASLYEGERGLKELKSEVDFVKSCFKRSLFMSGGIPLTAEVTVYDSLPEPSRDVYIHSLPLQQTNNDYLNAIVFYEPDLEGIGCMDNTGSDAQAQYSKTITSGFSFTLSEKICVGAKFCADVLLAKAEFNINLEISFTEQWNSTQSETISFTVPKNSKAYLYRGNLSCALMKYDIKKQTYSYTEKGRFLTNVIKTSPEPILGKPVMITKKEQHTENGLLPFWERP